MGLLDLLTPTLLKGGTPTKAESPVRDMKSWTVDPFAFMESMTHRERASSLTYEQLRQMAYRCDVIAAVIQTRVNQIASFCIPQPDRRTYGFNIVMRNGKKPGSKGADKVVQELSQFVMNGGIPGYGRDNFETFLRKYVRDSMVYDQAAFEIIPRQNGQPAFFEAIDSSTIRLAVESRPETDSLGMKMFNKDGSTKFQQAVADVQQMLMVKKGDGEQVPAKYVQLVDGIVRTTYAPEELYFGIRNPRTDLIVSGYGMSELELLIGAITSYLWAEEYNKRIFSQGSIPKGILNVKGEISETQMAAFRREWTNLIAGVQNSWKTPLLNAEDIEYINLQTSNKDMEYMQWIQFLMRIVCGVFLIDPAEINFDMPRGLDQSNAMIETSGEAKLRASKDRGLAPLLRFVQRSLNDGVIYRIDPDFELQFAGLEAKTEQEQISDSVQELSSFKTLNEVRAENDLEPIKEMGDIPLNPIYVQLVEAQQEQEQQEQLADLAVKNPDAALIMQGVDPKAERMKAQAEATATIHNAKADAHATRRESAAKADVIRKKGNEKKPASSGSKPKSKGAGAKSKSLKKSLDLFASVKGKLK